MQDSTLDYLSDSRFPYRIDNVIKYNAKGIILLLHSVKPADKPRKTPK